METWRWLEIHKPFVTLIRVSTRRSRMDYTNLHTFAVCAYKESEYLEACIESLLNQTAKAKFWFRPQHQTIKLKRRQRNMGSLFMLIQVKRVLRMTGILPIVRWKPRISHWRIRMTFICLNTWNGNEGVWICPKAADFFTDYYELRDGTPVAKNKLLRIKRILLWPMRFRCFKNSRFIRRRSLSLGCPICCPSVSFVRKNLPKRCLNMAIAATWIGRRGRKFPG